MAEFFAVFNVQEALSSSPTLTGANTDKNSATLKSAKVVKVTGTAVADVQDFIRLTYGTTSTPIVVTEEQWKSS